MKKIAVYVRGNDEYGLRSAVVLANDKFCRYCSNPLAEKNGEYFNTETGKLDRVLQCENLKCMEDYSDHDHSWVLVTVEKQASKDFWVLFVCPDCGTSKHIITSFDRCAAGGGS